MGRLLLSLPSRSKRNFHRPSLVRNLYMRDRVAAKYGTAAVRPGVYSTTIGGGKSGPKTGGGAGAGCEAATSADGAGRILTLVRRILAGAGWSVAGVSAMVCIALTAAVGLLLGNGGGEASRPCHLACV